MGNGFAKLIYSLPPNTGCMELVQYCTSLWETLKRDTALPKKLVSNYFLNVFNTLCRETAMNRLSGTNQ